MAILILGLVVFFAVHSLRIVSPAMRDGLVARIGEMPWRGLYSVVSFIGLGLIIYGFGLARQDPIAVYDPPSWGRHITMLLVLLAFIAIAVSLLPPGKLKPMLKHPMLAGIKLWAFGHLLANGDLASILLFGAFLAWAVVDRIALKRRPGVVLPKPGPVKYDVLAVVLALVVYGLFVARLHLALIGVPVV
ncbi:putative membrane protein [Hartmannibacter diazotrophicus]|uniref:Putative membrane protein n=1 Tax=Hartmannibacter diazotrophicus TaxID=1482074 RepID=A0A2C9D890_9HYPH|nr:NnrU family protein [Hartmannibacter diazotrophicus]SON56463.1 putative membrane protein [Hartmannibacter diazotrophicus]